MNNNLMERMLKMPVDFDRCVGDIIKYTHELNTLRAKREKREREVIAPILLGRNKTMADGQTRSTQRDDLLMNDKICRTLTVAIEECEEGIEEGHLALQSLHFEADILIAIANNDVA